MDSSGNMDHEGWRVFLLLTHSVAGGLPLGIIIAATEEEKVIFEGLELLKTILGDWSFSGRAKKKKGLQCSSLMTARQSKGH